MLNIGIAAPSTLMGAPAMQAGNGHAGPVGPVASTPASTGESRLEAWSDYLDGASSDLEKLGDVGEAVEEVLSGVSNALKMVTSGRDLVSSVHAIWVTRGGNKSASEKADKWAEVWGHTHSFLDAAAGVTGTIKAGADLIPDGAKLVLVGTGLVPVGVFSAIKVAPIVLGVSAWVARHVETAVKNHASRLAEQPAGTVAGAPSGGNSSISSGPSSPPDPSAPSGPPAPPGGSGSGSPLVAVGGATTSGSVPGTASASPANIPNSSPSSTNPSTNNLRSSTMINTNPETMRSVSAALSKFAEDIQTAKDALQESVSNAADSWADEVYTHTDSTVAEILQKIEPSEECSSLAEHIDNKATALEEYNAG